jgi:hypothetical protein
LLGSIIDAVNAVPHVNTNSELREHLAAEGKLAKNAITRF